jgi:hypothetical protein
LSNTTLRLGRLLPLTLVWLFNACSAGDGANGQVPGAPSGAVCEPDNTTAPCTCAGQPGRQVCAAGAWSACECATVPGSVPNGTGGGTSSGTAFSGNDRSDIHFDWVSSVPLPTDGTCPPGHYEGNIQGLYYSPINPTPIPLPIANFALPDQPSGFSFDLEPALGGETLQRVHGQVNGQVDLVIPFIVDVEGELNCRSGVFSGRLVNGHYSILIDGLLLQKFEGVAAAKYDKKTHTFINGTWDVAETTSTPPGTLAPSQPRDFTRDGYGGSGDFAAALPTDLNDPALTTCPANFTCAGGQLGPNKLLCNNALGTPTCLSDAECTPQFPGETVTCLKASLFSMCVRECKK